MSYRRGLLVTVAVAAVIAVAAAGISAAGQSGPTDGPEFEEFETESTISDPISQSGGIDPDSSVAGDGVIVVDDSNTNRFSRGDIQPLVEAIGRTGHEVRFHRRGNLSESLSGADALVVIDPGSPYNEDELDTVDEFVEDEGRLLILGEPTRTSVSAGLFGAEITQRESELTEIGSRFDVQFDTQYVYDQTTNDGTYQQVVAEPHEEAALPPDDGTSLDGVDEVAFDVATEVRSTSDGEPVLVTSSEARTAGAANGRRHTLAIRDDDVLAVGDASFISAGRHNVGDTNVFLASVVEFLVSAEGGGVDSGLDDPVSTDTGTDGGSDDASGNETDSDGGGGDGGNSTIMG